MSQPIKSNQFSWGAGTGDDERPVDRLKYRKNFDAIKRLGTKGELATKKGGKSTYTYK